MPAPAAGTVAPAADSGPESPLAIHRAAQDRLLAAGRQLVPEELAKRNKDPFNMWEEMRANGLADRFPQGH